MKRRKIVRDNWYFVEEDGSDANESERKLINDSLLSDMMKAQVRGKSFYSHLRMR